MENEEEELVECEYCHEMRKKSKMKTAYFFRANITGYVAGEVCEQCIGEYFRVCDDCGDYFDKNTMTETEEGDMVCDACLSENYVKCGECGDWIRENNARYVPSEDIYICDRCYDSYFVTCSDCGEIIREDSAYWVEYRSEYVCGSCYDRNYFTCDRCGEVYPLDESYELDGEYYCEYCYEEENREMESEEIMSYHGNRGRWEKFKTAKDNENSYYMGGELEIEHRENSCENQRNAVEIIKENINCYLEHDGSLNYGGFEIVTQPQTYNYFMDNYEKYKRAFEELVKLGYISHNSSNCGLHFHFTAPQENREDIVSRLWLIIETYKEQFEKISRRRNYHWCHFLSESISKNKRCNLPKMKLVNKDGSRYMVINNQNPNTIELRLFKGTLNIDTFYADLQLTNNLFNLAYDLSIPLEEITWAKLTKGKFISKYCKENNITTRKKFKDESAKFETLEVRNKKIAENIYKKMYKSVIAYSKTNTIKKMLTLESTINVEQNDKIYNEISRLRSAFAYINQLGKTIKNNDIRAYIIRDTIDCFVETIRNIEIHVDKDKMFEDIEKIAKNERLINSI